MSIVRPEGIDVSNHQGEILWPEVAQAGIVFSFVKATEGTSFSDKYYAHNIQGAKEQGIIAGPYHYLRPSLPATQQADFFFHQVESQGGHRGLLQPVVDFEETDGLPAKQVIGCLDRFLARAKVLFGADPIIYTYPYFWQRLLGNPTGYSGYPLWIASYAAAPHLVGDWKVWSFWQYTAIGHVRGISTIVDRNQWNGNIDTLRRMIIP